MSDRLRDIERRHQPRLSGDPDEDPQARHLASFIVLGVIAAIAGLIYLLR